MEARVASAVIALYYLTKLLSPNAREFECSLLINFLPMVIIMKFLVRIYIITPSKHKRINA